MTGAGGGAANGGTPVSTGGTSTGGTSTGGASTGGTGTGGTRAASGGAATGGATSSGGAPTGGAATGGAAGPTGGTTGVCTVGPPLSGGTPRCANGLGSLGNGYNWEIWMDSGTNCATMYGVGAAFRAEWALGTGGDFLARAGRFFGATMPHDQIGTISADYAFTKPTTNGFSWVAIYGWTFSNLAEYYIVEDWSVSRPGTTYQLRGTLTIDGGTYDIYSNRRVGATSPQGASTDFDQFWSVRRQARQCGHVSISEHFKQWQSLGMDISGLLRESMIVVEGLRGSGTVDFASATVQVN